MHARSLCLAVLGTLALGAPALAQKTSTQAIEEYREMLQDGNPADLFEMKGEELWSKKRGPKNASLQQCDLGKGPGVVKGAFVELPRWFADTGKVQDLESRLVTCMSTLQGIDPKEVINGQWGKGERANVTALATWVLLNTRFGNWIFAAGGDANAARNVGVRVEMVNGRHGKNQFGACGKYPWPVNLADAHFNRRTI